MRVLVCGDREWRDGAPIRTRLERLIDEVPDGSITVIHGAARGADSLAGWAADLLGLRVEEYPAEWGRYGRGAGPIRNQAMLDSGPDLIIAFHADLASSRGTADMVRRARAAGVPVEVIGGGSE